MDEIREAFKKVRQDIDRLNSDLNYIKTDLNYIKTNISKLNYFLRVFQEDIKKINTQIHNFSPKKQEIDINQASTNISLIPTDTTDSSTHQHIFKPLKEQILGISTGNQGVPTDRQTHQQTDRHIENLPKNEEISTQNQEINPKKDPIKDAAYILDSLDSLKKEIRLKFKRLTEREITIFSILYQLDEEQGHADYKSIAQRLNLTESSIRDYIGRLINKGIPVDKKRINNKQIHLFISPNLKKIASLSTIMQLRSL